ncbi:serine/threonine-protein kinase 11-interacting protein isoform X4 [Balaenoptera acutorostrata]|uniref:Serine/threonine-protein kinase 11-interacting protein n=1 Tax=Balaenoptera acutorostrata TaxID=9767 RepID=A0ABM3U064_BALAC|nr:serine/threonine-protein kinase 11-interacting protein isoform X4 [Balaenoptera acutorostrata]
MTTAPRDSLVWKLAGLLREYGDAVLSGRSTLSLLTATLQQLNHVFELHLGPWGPGQTGFVALPSHPADSPVILQLQFLFDVLQKTLSLKLVHVPGLGLPGPIKIFPFKSLRQLELRGVPLHCLHGLRAIYSQLETLICSRSLQALEELLSACGGDLCSALPWLALLSADFSYNTLTALDSSLRLLSALRFLNLSHNQVQDCEGFLRDLSELCHLDISYNHLRLVPRMGPSGAALGTLILRGNELQSLHGLEQLRNLRHLDVAYNLLERHRELSPLWLLAELRKLCLEGNPLWFHPEHRAATARCLSPRARDAAAGFLLDGKALSLTDFQTSPSSGLGPMAPPLPWPVGSTTETSGGPDLSDSPSSGGVVAQPQLRKVKSRVRVRRASISEPSDTDPEPRTLDPSPAGRFVQQHRELELMNSFRDRFGRDWLQYRNHLEASGPAALGTRPPDAPSPEAVRGPPPPEKGSPQEEAEAVRVEPEPQEEEELEEGEEEGGKEEEEEEQSELEESPAVCPNCGSDHVVLLSPGTPSGEQGQGEQSPAPSQSPSPGHSPPGHSAYSTRAGSAPSQAPASRDRHSWSLSPPPERCGLRSVDHRLRLFLDVEVFTDAQEEFQCCLKVPLVLAGHPGEFLCLTVVSDHRLYVLKVTGEIRGPPAGWLQPTLAIPLQDLSSIELGLAGQSLRLEWAAGAGGCVLLPRDARHCRAFLEELTDVLQSLPPTRRSSVSATEEEVTPKHRLWPLLETDPSLEPLRFFYLRAFLVEGPSTCPVSLLLTLSTLYLLDEDPIGSQAEPPLAAASGEASEKAPAPGPGPLVRVREQQPLSSLSSVLLYRGAPDDLRLVFYDEVSRLESFWALHVVCPEQLTALLAWIREPWEELFSIGLRTVTQEALDLDQ